MLANDLSPFPDFMCGINSRTPAPFWVVFAKLFYPLWSRFLFLVALLLNTYTCKVGGRGIEL